LIYYRQKDWIKYPNSIKGDSEMLPKKKVVYISNTSNCENDLVESFLEMFFGIEIYAFGQDDADLAEELVRHVTNPGCIIISIPLSGEGRSPEELWPILRELFPTAPIIWLFPDCNNIPGSIYCLENSQLITEGLLILSSSKIHIRDLINCLDEVGIKLIWKENKTN
jgi:hypothetical protein